MVSGAVEGDEAWAIAASRCIDEFSPFAFSNFDSSPFFAGRSIGLGGGGCLLVFSLVVLPVVEVDVVLPVVVVVVVVEVLVVVVVVVVGTKLPFDKKYTGLNSGVTFHMEFSLRMPLKGLSSLSPSLKIATRVAE